MLTIFLIDMYVCMYSGRHPRCRGAGQVSTPACTSGSIWGNNWLCAVYTTCKMILISGIYMLCHVYMYICMCVDVV